MAWSRWFRCGKGSNYSPIPYSKSHEGKTRTTASVLVGGVALLRKAAFQQVAYRVSAA